MPPLRGAKRRRKAALEKKAAAAAMAAAAAGDAPSDWWDAFCMRMSGASPSPPSASGWLPVVLAGGRASVSVIKICCVLRGGCSGGDW